MPQRQRRGERQLWQGAAVELRGRLISLGLWAQRETDRRLDDGGSLEPLMTLHRDMIEALEAQRAMPAMPAMPIARMGETLPFTARVA